MLLQSSLPPHRWTPARGTLEDGEEEMTTAIREVREETGLLLKDLWLHDDLRREVTYKGRRKFVGYIFRCDNISSSESVCLSRLKTSQSWNTIRRLEVSRSVTQ